MTGTELELRRRVALAQLADLDHYEYLWKLAQVYAKLPIAGRDLQGKPEVMLAGMLLVEAIGFDARAAVGTDFLYYWDGQLRPSYQLYLAAAHHNGFETRWEVPPTPELAVLYIRPRGGLTWEEYSYTIAQATTAGLAGKDVWKKYPADMLAAKAVKRAIRQHCPEVMAGIHRLEQADIVAPDDASEEVPDEVPAIQSGADGEADPGENVPSSQGRPATRLAQPEQRVSASVRRFCHTALSMLNDDEVEWVRSHAKVYGIPNIDGPRLTNEHASQLLDLIAAAARPSSVAAGDADEPGPVVAPSRPGSSATIAAAHPIAAQNSGAAGDADEGEPPAKASPSSATTDKPKPPPYRPDKELIGHIEAGQRPLGDDEMDIGRPF